MSKAVKQIAGVAAMAVGAYFGQPWLVAIGAGMLAQSFVKTPDAGQLEQSELKQIVRSSKEPAHYVFGRAGTGALLAWAQEEPGEQDEGERLYLVYVLTEGTIEGIDQIYVDQEGIDSAGDRIDYEVISGATEPNGYMLEHSPDWQETQIGRGLTWVRVTLKYDPEYFAAGIPNLLFEYRARNDIYDPRTETSGYTDNAALVILWYVRHRLRVPDDEILWDTFIDAANICDEIVTNPDGSTERRYTVSGGFKADERKDRILADLEAACAGSLIRIGGKFGLQVGAYYGPYELTIDEDMVVGTVTGQTEVSRADAVNTVRGKFTSPEQRWTETDYPAVSVAEWIEEDGEQIEESLDLRFVSSPYQSQRLANIKLRRKRAGGVLELPLNFRGYACRPGRVVQVNLPTLNIVGEFRVLDWDFSGENACKVTLQQEQAEIYDDAVGQPFDPFNFINLPAGGIGSPTGLRFVVENVGEVVQGVLLWNPVDAALHYNVVIKHDGQAVQSAQVPAGVERCEIGGLISGNYVAEVRARGRLGLSGPASINFSVSAPPMPERVITQIGNREITLIPMIAPGASLNGGHYRYYWTMDPNATQAQSELLGEGLTFTHTGLAPLHTYYYYVQSVNAYGSSPFLKVEVETTLEFDEEFAWLEEQLRAPGGIIYQFENDINLLADAIEDVAGTVDGAREDAANAREDAESALESALEAVRNGDLNALEQEIRFATLQAQNAMGNAVMDVEHSVRVSEEFALAQSITTLEVTFDGKVAFLEQEFTVLANDQLALSQSVLTLNATVDDNTAEIVETQQSIALDGIAQSISNAVIQAQNALGNAVVDVEYLARTDQERSIAQQVITLDAQFRDNTASVRQELTALVDDQQALAQEVTELETEYEGNKSSVNDTLISLSNETSATAGRLSRFEVEVDGEFASVQQDVSAVYDPSTGAVARAVTTVNANGRQGVLGIQVNGRNSEIIGIADQFAILNPINGQLVTAFIVSDGRVIIPNALIRDLKASNIDVDDLVVSRGQSKNYSAGTAGWRLTQTGGEINFPIEFRNVRGAGELAGKNSLNYEELSGSTAPLVLERANNANNRTTDWTRPDSTRIDGNKIATGYAYVGTLEIAGRAVTMPVSTAANDVIRIGNGESVEVLRAVIDTKGENVLAFTSFTTNNAGYRVEIRRNGVPVIVRPGGVGPVSVIGHVGATGSGTAIFTVQFVHTGQNQTVEMYARSLGLLATYR